jgi:hypothetical protein
MGLEGEEVYTGWAYADGNNFYSESWSIDMPAAAAFALQFLIIADGNCLRAYQNLYICD